jgi:hypothetical protein
MSQSSLIIADGNGQSVLNEVSSALQALASQNSGNTAPTTTYPGMPWLDTSTTPATYRMRNAANSAWLVLGTDAANLGNATQAAIQSGAYSFAADTGTANAYAFAVTPAITAYAEGQMFWFVAAHANTGASTVNVNAVGAINLVHRDGTALQPNDILAGSACHAFLVSATVAQLMSASPVTVPQIQSISASVASNALTVNYAGSRLDFRNATAGNGAPISNVLVSANAITIPSGATLGTVSGQTARLVFLEAYNGGSPVLCVANLSGGLNLDETGLISPTTISAGATAANVIYSATAVSANSPYRIVGFVDVTEAAAGTWATAPSLVQGAGGQALAALSSLGYGQTLQNVTGSRSFGTNYYNTKGRPIFVNVTAHFSITSGTGFTAYVNGVIAGSMNGGGGAANASGNACVPFIVPPGGNYSVTSSDGSLQYWSEFS